MAEGKGRVGQAHPVCTKTALTQENKPPYAPAVQQEEMLAFRVMFLLDKLAFMMPFLKQAQGKESGELCSKSATATNSLWNLGLCFLSLKTGTAIPIYLARLIG